jgi:hypothetical protein
MNRHLAVFAQSFIGDAFEWITSGFDETTRFVREWIVERFDAQVFGVITAIIVVFAILVRINSSRRL